MDLFHSQKNPERSISRDELVRSFQLIRTKLIVWGSFDTIRTFDQMGEMGLDMQKTSDPTTSLVWLSRLIAHMRKDLGHNDPKDAMLELALGLVVPEDRVKLREALKKAD